MHRPDRLLTQNSEMRAEGIHNWSLPAWAGRLPDGRTYNTCPSAGVCRLACYALNGTYLFSNVRARHLANLAYTLDDLPGWETQMVAELAHRRHAGGWVRIHDSGDFYSEPYLAAWLRVMRARPGVRFYAYTKEVAAFRRLVEPDPPVNFRWVFSLGGRQDHLVTDHDRVADVFPDEWSMVGTGYHSQDASDLLAARGRHRVGIPANNITAARRRQGDRTFSQWQRDVDAARRARRGGPR